jgi:hypothetical protein
MHRRTQNNGRSTMKRVFTVLIMVALFTASSSGAIERKRYTKEQKRQFREWIEAIETPEDVATWMRRNFEYDYYKFEHHRSKVGYSKYRSTYTHHRGETHKPIQVFFDKKGVCIDASNFVAFVLKQKGYRAFVMYVTDPYSMGHWVAVFKDAGSWYKMGDTRCLGNIWGPYDDLSEVARKVNGIYNRYKTLPPIR